MSTETATPDPTLIDPLIVFTIDNDCWCDLCIEHDAAGWSWERLTDFGDYVGNPKLILRKDAVGPFPTDPDLEQPVIVPMPPDWTLEQRDWAKVPDELPPVSTKPQSPNMLDKIDRASLTMRGHDDAYAVHLYLGTTHVGWTRHSNPGTGLTLDELPIVRRIAGAAGINLYSALTALRTTQETTS